MLRIKRRSETSLKVIFILFVLFFTGSALAGNRDKALLTQAQQIFGPLPKAMGSEINPVTPEKGTLGKILFYETRISADGTVSCARCHPIALYAADGLKSLSGLIARSTPETPLLFSMRRTRFQRIG
jgi:cytochrome c peroxidase